MQSLRYGTILLLFAVQHVCGNTPAVKLLRSADSVSKLINGDLSLQDEDGFAGWQPWQRGYQIAEGDGRNGTAAAHCDGDGQQGLWQTVELNQQRPLPVMLCGWSKAANVNGGRDSGYSVYVDLTYVDGEPLWGQHAPFDIGNHDWQQQSLTIIPTKPIRSMNAYALFRGHTGQVWFDDLEAYELGSGEGITFDGNPVEDTQPIKQSIQGMGYRTENGLTLGYAWEAGQVTDVRIGEQQYASTGIPSGFLVRDAAADSDYYGFEAGVCMPLGLKLEAQIEAKSDHLRISGQVTDTHNTDRAITLVFALPIDATGWTWYDDAGHGRNISERQEYTNLVNIGTGATGAMSLYPWAVICGPSDGLAIGLDMGTPGQYRIGYNTGTHHFFIAYDFGLSPETQNFPNGAPFAFVLYRTDSNWGFRSATKRFYDVFPDHFVCRSKDQGIWMPFTDVSTVEGWEDFGFKYHEGINNVPFDDSADVLSFRYTEPSTWWMRMPTDVPRTHEGVMQSLDASVQSEDGRIRRAAQALQISGSHDSQERLQYLIRKEPWCDGAVFSLSPSPYLPGGSEARMAWNDEIKERLYGPDAKGTQDGEYLDSLEAYVTANENFRRDHFRYLTVPLTFSTVSKRPVIHKIFSVYEFTRWISEDLHQMGKLLFANSVPHRFTFLCPWIDVMGTEMNWVRDGKWQPASDSWMSFKRAMCYHKPYLFLMNTRYDQFTPDLVEKYFQRSLFYGMFPGMFSHNAAEDPYWRAPKWYNRDRHLFKRYIPLIKRIAEAGWEPITHARSSNAAVLVERFGPDEQGGIYFTVMDSSEEAQECILQISVRQLRISPAQVQELIESQVAVAHTNGELLEIPIQLEPEQVKLFYLVNVEAR